MANRYWVGGSGNWSDSAHWATSSGGVGGASVPTASDNVVFDANSASLNFTVTLAANTAVSAFDSSSLAKQLTFSGNYSFTTNGNVSLAKTQFGWAAGRFIVAGISTISMDASSYLNFPTFTGQTTLASNLVGIYWLSTEGLFDTDSFDINAYFMDVADYATLGSSTITTNAWAAYGVVDAQGSTIILNGSYSSGNIFGSFMDYVGNAYNHVRFVPGSTGMGLLGEDYDADYPMPSIHINTLEIVRGLRIDSNSNHTINNLIANGTAQSQIVLRSTVSGVPFTLTKTSGTVDANYLDLKDSVATGGATWNANSSVDSGNNTGWHFIGPVAPTANFTADVTSGRAPLTVQFTDTSMGAPTAWSWNFGDGTTSTAQHPLKTYSNPGTYTVQLYVSNSLGGNTKTVSPYITATATVVSPASIAASDGVGQPQVIRHGRPVNLGSIDSSEAFGELSIGRQLYGLGDIPTAEALGELSTIVGNKTVFPDGIAATDAFGTPEAIRRGLPVPLPSVQDGETFDEPTILRGPVGITGAGDIVEVIALDEPTITQTAPPPPPPTDWSALGKEDEKHYIYKVYKRDWSFFGTWNDVHGDPKFSQKLNTPGTTMEVELTRSPNTTKENRTVLTTEDGTPITTEDGHELMVSYETNNSVGEETDLDIGYYVDVYVVYGGFDVLTTETGEPLTTQDGEEILVSYGAPNGVRIFSGFVLDYELLYEESTGAIVTLASHGYKLSHELVRSGETVKVTYSSQPVHDILKSVLDTNPQTMSYSIASINTTYTTPVTLKFALNTKHEAIKSIYEQTPDGWYWYGNVADNYVYLQPASTTPRHVFVKGYHIKGLRLKRSMEGLRNKVYFVGAEVNGVNILKKYQDTESQDDWGVGLHRITDRRFSLADSMQRRADKEMSGGKQPVWTTEVTISSAKYDLESIKLGQTIAFRNFGNFVDGLVLQIVGLTYTPTRVTLEVGELLEESTKIVADIEEGLQNEQYEKIPDTPS